MADATESPIAVKVEGHSRSVILTYFQGDTGSMVDAHFKRALSKGCKAKAPAAKMKRPNKPFKLEESTTCQKTKTYSEQQVKVLAGHPELSKDPHCSLSFSPAETPQSLWHSFPTRPAEGPALHPITYSLSSEGLGITGHQYTNSLLNLLHSDQTEVGTSVASTSKPELLPSWTVPQGFRDSADPAAGFEPGQRMEKKDLYWY
ncbi:transcription cofactor vestigial-like protein 1 [Thalassophryne amazonica]|uniref:transcription cofactor vestigial-like protein 1 n=1 Tax=Thalassophryne amazonica TaxID=390379 RepID=UPI001471E7CB|nr:transcription cofactor vestigial-like protein 1 [Thalassophryne amazonica]